jgi:hypothetical protein
MQIENVNIEELKPYENNAKKDISKSVELVKQSIEDYGMNVPLVIDSENVIICGHTRFEALKELGYKLIPCIRKTDLTEEQIKAYRIVDNRTAEFFTWDIDKLKEELKDLEISTIYEFDDLINNNVEDAENPYTIKREFEKYEPSNGEGGAEVVEEDFTKLCNSDKVLEFQNKIEALDTSEEIKNFLKATATRFYDFNFKNIAEFYARTTPEIQSIMEELALVIIDYDKALELGFVKLNKRVEELFNSEYGEED